jgi:hypothetical protein
MGWITPSLAEAPMQVKVFSSYTWANLYVRCLS